jgi:hypothetical protein
MSKQPKSKPEGKGDQIDIAIGDNAQNVAAGKGVTQIVGDGNVIGDGSSSQVNKTETHFHGPVTGPVHTGSGDIHIGSMQVGADASLEALLAALRQAVAAQSPAELQSQALQRLNLLAEAVAEHEPDLGLMESVVSWFQKRLPSLTSGVIAVIFHPAVVQTVEAGGEATLAEFQRRFGRLSDRRRLADQ